jgi:hypothetical protein
MLIPLLLEPQGQITLRTSAPSNRVHWPNWRSPTDARIPAYVPRLDGRGKNEFHGAFQSLLRMSTTGKRHGEVGEMMECWNGNSLPNNGQMIAV